MTKTGRLFRCLVETIGGAALACLVFLPGCGDRVCTTKGYFSGATLELHLAPVSTIAQPETVKACREPTCVTTTMPDLPPDAGRLASVTFSPPTEVSGLLGPGVGGVRVLTLDWNVSEPIAEGSNAHHYTIHVTDAAGQETASFDDLVTYARDEPNGEGCGVRWYARAGD